MNGPATTRALSLAFTGLHNFESHLFFSHWYLSFLFDMLHVVAIAFDRVRRV